MTREFRLVAPVAVAVCVVALVGACPYPPTVINNQRCSPAHVEQPEAPSGILCEGEIDIYGTPYCEPVNCEGEFTQTPEPGNCGGTAPASGSSGCRQNHGTVDLELKVYIAYCDLLVEDNQCKCKLRQPTDPVTGMPRTKWERDVCECRNI